MIRFGFTRLSLLLPVAAISMAATATGPAADTTKADKSKFYMLRVFGNQSHEVWDVSSNTAGEFHLHAYRLSVTLQAGQTTELAFTAFSTGIRRPLWPFLKCGPVEVCAADVA